MTLAVRGIDEDVVTAASEATVAAGAASAGVLWLTERFVLDDQSEIDDLAEVLGVPPSSPDGLHRIARRQLGALLARAAVPPDAPSDTTTTTTIDPEEQTTSTTTVIDSEPLPELVQRLIDAGFLDYEPPAVAAVPPGPFAPSSGLRLLAISGEGAVVPDDVIMVPILDQVSGGAVAGEPGPVAVAAQRGPAFDPAPPDDADPAAARVVFVGPIRDDEDLRARLSTVDDLEAFPGLVAMVLALRHGASGQYGHYGVGEGAQSLLPPPVDAGEAPG